MRKKAVYGVLLTIFLILLMFKVRQVIALETIRIRSDGSVSGTSNIRYDRNTYTLTSDVFGVLIVEKDNIVINGSGYTLRGTGNPADCLIGINVSSVTVRRNVTITNMKIQAFYTGILLGEYSVGNTVSGNTITNNYYGIQLGYSSNNNICGNNITGNSLYGVSLGSSNGNTVSKNNITNNPVGVYTYNSPNNTIISNYITDNTRHGIYIHYRSENTFLSRNNIIGNTQYGLLIYSSDNSVISECNITDSNVGVWLSKSSNNQFILNNFVNNTKQVYDISWDYPQHYTPSINIWDGNHWSDYIGEDVDEDGIGDTPYIIDSNNQDRCPYMNILDPIDPLPNENGDDIDVLGEFGVYVSHAAEAFLYAPPFHVTWVFSNTL